MSVEVEKIFLEGKSLEELTAISQNIRDRLLTAESPIVRQQLLDQLNACTELVENIAAGHRAKLARIQKITAYNENNFKERKEKAILNLKEAASPNGQLVAAILEDENGLTLEELHAWCEELQMIDEDEFNNLIENLCKYGIVYEEEGRYFLQTIWEGDVKLKNYYEIAIRRADKHNLSILYKPDINRFVLSCISFMDLTPAHFSCELLTDLIISFVEETWSEEELLGHDVVSEMHGITHEQAKELIKDRRKLEYSIKSQAGRLISLGLMRETLLHGEKIYGMRLLGETFEEKGDEQ